MNKQEKQLVEFIKEYAGILEMLMDGESSLTIDGKPTLAAEEVVNVSYEIIKLCDRLLKGDEND